MLTKYSQLNWTLADQAMVSVVNFLTGFLLARQLGVSAYGQFSLAWMVVLFFSSIQTAVIISPMMSIGPKKTEKDGPFYYGSVFLQQLIWTVFSFILVHFFSWGSHFFWPKYHLLSLAIPLSFALVTFQAQDFLRRYFFVCGLPGYAFFTDSISYLGQLLILFSLLNRLDVTSTLYIIAATSTLAIIASLYWLKSLSFSRDKFKEHGLHHLHFSKWLVGSAFMQWTSWNYFIIAASAQLGPSAAGAIKATQNIVGVTHILFQGLSNIVPVHSARVFHCEGVIALKQYLIKVSLYGGGITALFCFIVGVAPDTWLALLYGTEYIGYGYVLRWWSACYFLIFFGVPLTAGVRALENTRPMFIAYCIMTFFSLILASSTVNSYGLNGAMFGIFCCQIILITILLSSLLRSIRSEQIQY